MSQIRTVGAERDIGRRKRRFLYGGPMVRIRFPPAASQLKTTKDGAGFPIGCGYWTRANPEQCLLATRGRPQRLLRSVRQLIFAPRRLHSQKPDETCERIEALVSGPYLEMFARERRPGWDCWGSEVDSGIGERRWASNSYPQQERAATVTLLPGTEAGALPAEAGQ
jgi:hypothetical protein